MRISVEFGPAADAGVSVSDVLRVHAVGDVRWVVTANAADFEFGSCAPALSRAMLDAAVAQIIDGTGDELARVDGAFAAARRVVCVAEGLGSMTICCVSPTQVDVRWVGADVVSASATSFSVPHTAVRDGVPYGHLFSQCLTAYLPRHGAESQRLARDGERVLLLSHELACRVPPGQWRCIDELVRSDALGDLDDSPFWFYVALTD